MLLSLSVNGQAVQVDVDGKMPLLWVLRDVLGLTGTKYGCGIEVCGACTVLLNGEAERAASARSRKRWAAQITTIEGLSPDRSHPLQQAWISRAGAAVRLLPVRHADGGRRHAAASIRSRPTRDIDATMHEHLRLRHLPAHPRAAMPSTAARDDEDPAASDSPGTMLAATSARPVANSCSSGAAGGGFDASASRVARRRVRPPRRRPRTDAATPVGAWIRIGADETVTILVGSSEMGQGVLTGLPQIVAEELMVDWSKVKAAHARRRRPGLRQPAVPLAAHRRQHRACAATTSRLRKAGASAREMLIAAGADALGRRPLGPCSRQQRDRVRSDTARVAQLRATRRGRRPR